MPATRSRLRLAALLLATTPLAAHANPFGSGQLVVSYSVYQGSASTLAVGAPLPNTNGATAVASGAYPGVFANDGPDGNFGVTAPIYLQAVSAPNGITDASAPTLNITAATGITTSFSSKSELGLSLATDGQSLTLSGYNAPVNQLDRSNSNTPGVIDPTNSDTAPATSRSIVQVGLNGSTSVTNTNNYSGNNGRTVIYNAAAGVYYAVGNSGNGAKATDSVTTPGSVGASLLSTTGVQVVVPGTGASGQAGLFTTSTAQSPGVDNYTLKDNNFRGETISNNTLYVTKGSGSNGVNTVYQVGTAGTLPTGNGSGALSILPGLPTTAAGVQTCTATACGGYHLPFGLFFANSSTLYIADEGYQSTTPVNDTSAGLEKWSLVNGTWVQDYVLQSGLNLGIPYTVPLDPSGNIYPAALDPFNTGLRSLSGTVNADGTVTLYAATATYSASGDPGADPNAVVAVSDVLADTTGTQAAGESFSTVEGPQYGVVYRGVAVTPVPEPATLGLLGLGFAWIGLVRRRRRAA